LDRRKEKDRGKHGKSSSSYVDGGSIFYIDKKGDKDAFFYGESNRSDIPSYRRSGGTISVISGNSSENEVKLTGRLLQEVEYWESLDG
jgi:hypothetical protein